MNDVISAIGQKIQVGDWVACANGSYVRQEFGIVTKLGNKQNARVHYLGGYYGSGNYVDAAGLVVINEIKGTMDEDKLEKFQKLDSEVELDYTRPKSSKAPKYMVLINPKENMAWVFSFQDEAERNRKMAAVRGGSSSYGIGVVHKDSRSSYFRKEGDPKFHLHRFCNRKSDYELSMKSVKIMGVEGFIDDESGFNMSLVRDLEPISKHW